MTLPDRSNSHGRSTPLKAGASLGSGRGEFAVGSKGLVSDLEVYYEILAYFDMQVDQGAFVQAEGGTY